MSSFPLLLQLVKLSLEASAILILTVLLVYVVRSILSRRAKLHLLRPISGPPPTSFMYGNLLELYSPDGALYSSLAKYGGVAKVHGLFGDVSLAVSDPRALTQILVKDAASYTAIDWSGTLGLFGPGLLANNGAPHRRQRKLLNPSFVPSHVRKLAPLVHKISGELRDAIGKEISTDGSRTREIDVAEWLSRAGLEMITRAGFGHSFHAFQGDGDAYAQAVKAIAPTFMQLGALISFFIMSGAGGLPTRVLRIMGGAAALVLPAAQGMVDIVNVLQRDTMQIWETRKAQRYTEDGADQGDQLLSVLRASIEQSAEGRVPDVELFAHATTLVVAGTDTTSTALSRILHLLTLRPDLQDKLRDELVHAQSEAGSEELAYEVLMELPFLDAVCKEMLRLYAPLPFRGRRSLKDTTIPLVDGTSVHVPADTEILVNIHCLNTDEAIWGPDAHQWRPERWQEPLPDSVLTTKIPGVWGATMTFGAGPKGCIGFSFSVLEMKSILATLLTSFRFSLPTNRELEWRFGPIVVPGVKGEQSVNPKMPLTVERLQAR
ncbi:cytochrome P450 [Peniophora sp. CONT]|nr:cytochrome P450 [Peniophora sp. CONT]